jgi:flavin-binding monooxygenase-like protein
MPESREKMAIIGAGPVGLGMAKALKVSGIPYDQFEADDDVGGNWYHGVYFTTHTISSRRVTEYPEYPMPAEYPDYPSQNQVLAYLRDYTRHFALADNISFNTKVLMARPRPDQLWDVTLATGETRTYKGLVVSNGHDWSRRYPEYPGEFAGEYIHSKDYKRPEQLAGRRVLVIGAGNSASDIASEAARVGLSSDVSMRRGYWFVPKILFGKPFHEAFPLATPIWLHRLLLRMVLKIAVGDYRRYGLQRPDHKLFTSVPTVSSELLHYLRHGRITPRPDVARFDGNRVEFVDGSAGTYDLVVCATGFNLEFPFFPKGLVPIRNGVAPLYGGVVLPDYKHLYIASAIHPIYGFGPMISAGGDLLACLIPLQDRIELPLGRVMQACGQKPAATHLLHPAAALRELRWARRLLPVIVPVVERRLRRTIARQTPAPVAVTPSESLNPDMTVY